MTQLHKYQTQIFLLLTGEHKPLYENMKRGLELLLTKPILKFNARRFEFVITVAQKAFNPSIASLNVF